MSQNGNSDSNGNNSKPAIPWGTKAGYIGTGILIGLIAYPFVRKVLAKVQPRVDEMLDGLTGKAEDLAERASDLMAKARMNLSRAEEANGAEHAGHSHARKKKPEQTQ